MSLKQTPPSLLASSALLRKEGEKSKQKYPESTVVTVVALEGAVVCGPLVDFAQTALAKKGVVEWFSATTEEYTISDHIRAHGVSIEK